MPLGTLWIGTHGGGLSRFKDGRFATISTRQGLYNDHDLSRFSKTMTRTSG